eukprot:EG_transcript_25747
MPPLLPLLTAGWALPAAGFMFSWMYGSAVVYFFRDAQAAAAGMAEAYLPATGVDPSIHAALPHVLGAYWAERFFTLRVHIVLSIVMGTVLVLNLNPYIRKASIATHRRLGFLFLLLCVPFVAEQSFTVLVRGMLPLGPEINFFNHLALAVIAGGTLAGWYFARAKQIGRHRTTMLFVAASFFLNPTQRFWWGILGRSGYKAPYPHFGAFVEGPVAMSEIIAACSCYGVAAVYAFLLSPRERTKCEKSQ